MYFVKRFGLVCRIAADASSRSGRDRDGLRGRGTTTIEPTGTDTSTTGIYGEATDNVPATDLLVEDIYVENYQREEYNPFGDRIGLDLHRAAWAGQVEAVRTLIDQGANVDEAVLAGFTPLMAAVHSGNCELVALILHRGANVNRRNEINGSTSLLMAIENGDVGIVNCLIDNGADVNQARLDGYSPLMAARQVEMVDLLIRAGADINHEDNGGRTALMTVAGYGSVEGVGRLIEAGADVAHTTREGRTALMIAAMVGSVDVVDRLIEAGADVGHTTTRGGQSALMMAARVGSVGVVDRLIEAGADVAYAAPDGATALTVVLIELTRFPNSPGLLAVRDALTQLRYVLK